MIAVRWPPITPRCHEGAERIGQQERSARDGGDGGPVRNERGRIVEQGLAFDERDHDARRAEATEDGRCREGVGRGDDGAEREGGGPAHPGDRGVGRDRDEDHREHDEPDREAEERAEVRPQIASRARDGRAEEQSGRNTNRMRSGSSWIRGRAGTKARPSPPSTSRVGYGTPIRRATS